MTASSEAFASRDALAQRLAEKALFDARDRMLKRPLEDFGPWLVGEQLRGSPFPLVAQAVEINIAAMILALVEQLVPRQREAAGLILLRHISEHVRFGLANPALAAETTAPTPTTEAAHG